MAEITVDQLRPGMVLLQDVQGVSGRPIVPKGRILTEEDIEFIEAFLIEKVHVQIPVSKEALATIPSTDKEKLLQEEGDVLLEDAFMTVYEEVVGQFKLLFRSWQSNLPVKMYAIRQLCTPLFELVETKSIDNFTTLLQGKKEDIFYYKTVALSLLSIKLAQELGYEKKDWLQIGFAALLADIGLAKTEIAIDSSRADRNHPIRSYEMVKKEVTLTDHAKLAIVQHHEYLDGSGFPMGLQQEKIHPYAQIIAISDRFYTLQVKVGEQVYDYLEKEKDKFAPDLLKILARG